MITKTRVSPVYWVLPLVLAALVAAFSVTPAHAAGATVTDSAAAYGETKTFRVTVPNVLPIYVKADSNVAVSYDAVISNNSDGEISLNEIGVVTMGDWELVDADDVRLKNVGAQVISMSLQGVPVNEDGTCAAQFPNIGMKEAVPLYYGATVPAQDVAMLNTEIAQVQYVFGWVEEEIPDAAPIVVDPDSAEYTELTEDIAAAVAVQEVTKDTEVMKTAAESAVSQYVDAVNAGTTASPLTVNNCKDYLYVTAPALLELTEEYEDSNYYESVLADTQDVDTWHDSFSFLYSADGTVENAKNADSALSITNPESDWGRYGYNFMYEANIYTESTQYVGAKMKVRPMTQLEIEETLGMGTPQAEAAIEMSAGITNIITGEDTVGKLFIVVNRQEGDYLRTSLPIMLDIPEYTTLRIPVVSVGTYHPTTVSLYRMVDGAYEDEPYLTSVTEIGPDDGSGQSYYEQQVQKILDAGKTEGKLDISGTFSTYQDALWLYSCSISSSELSIDSDTVWKMEISRAGYLTHTQEGINLSKACMTKEEEVAAGFSGDYLSEDNEYWFDSPVYPNNYCFYDGVISDLLPSTAALGYSENGGKYFGTWKHSVFLIPGDVNGDGVLDDIDTYLVLYYGWADWNDFTECEQETRVVDPTAPGWETSVFNPDYAGYSADILGYGGMNSPAEYGYLTDMALYAYPLWDGRDMYNRTNYFFWYTGAYEIEPYYHNAIISEGCSDATFETLQSWPDYCSAYKYDSVAEWRAAQLKPTNELYGYDCDHYTPFLKADLPEGYIYDETQCRILNESTGEPEWPADFDSRGRLITEDRLAAPNGFATNEPNWREFVAESLAEANS